MLAAVAVMLMATMFPNVSESPKKNIFFNDVTLQFDYTAERVFVSSIKIQLFT